MVVFRSSRRPIPSLLRSARATGIPRRRPKMQMHTYASRDQHRCERHNFVTRREKSLAADNQRWRASVRFEARAGSRETRPTGVRARCRSSYRYETSCERTPSTCQGNWIRKIRFETPFARRSREDREKIGCT